MGDVWGLGAFTKSEAELSCRALVPPMEGCSSIWTDAIFAHVRSHLEGMQFQQRTLGASREPQSNSSLPLPLYIQASREPQSNSSLPLPLYIQETAVCYQR